MRQHISVEQLNELSDKAKEKLRGERGRKMTDKEIKKYVKKLDRNTLEKISKDYFIELDSLLGNYLKCEAKIWMRCEMEGCRYRYSEEEDLKDNCIYCGTPRLLTPASFYSKGIVEMVNELQDKLKPGSLVPVEGIENKSKKKKQ